MFQTVLNLALFIVLLLSFAWRSIDSTVISNSQLERCVLNGTVTRKTRTRRIGCLTRQKVSSGNDNNVVCEEKLVVTIAIEGGRELETESLKFDLTCIGRYPFFLNSKSTCFQHNLSVSLQLRFSSGLYLSRFESVIGLGPHKDACICVLCFDVRPGV